MPKLAFIEMVESGSVPIFSTSIG